MIEPGAVDVLFQASPRTSDSMHDLETLLIMI